MEEKLKDLKWIQLSSANYVSARVPEIPGIYAYGEVVSTGNLPRSIEWVYIGKAKNLSRRLRQHELLDEANSALRSWIRHSSEGVLWYSAVEEELLSDVEVALVSKISPKFNKILFSGRNKGG